MARTVEFTKMHGAGNDYVYVNAFRFAINNPEKLSILWSDRHKGIGSDGLILIGPSECADFSMRMFNNDGSEGRMCGNASRCIARYVYEEKLTDKTDILLETLSGIKTLHLNLDADGALRDVTVDMGEPGLCEPDMLAACGGSMTAGEVLSTDGTAYRGTFVSMGNPHFVIFTEGVDELDLEKIGPTMEFASAFPQRCNIEFAQIRPDGTIRMRVWERGSGITMACGTGACATAVAAALEGRRGRTSTIVMDGGALQIEWRESDSHVYMTGEAVRVFDGTAVIED